MILLSKYYIRKLHPLKLISNAAIRNSSFSGLSAIYNDLHYDENLGHGRYYLWEERLTEAWFLYALLGLSEYF